VIPQPDFSTLDWVLAAIAALCIGLTKAGLNGFGIITVLLMARIMPAKESTGAVLPMLIAADLMAIGIYRRHVSWKDFWSLLPMTSIGLVAGWLIMRHLPEQVFGKSLGWMILLMMLVVLWQRFDQRVLSGIMHHPVLATGSGLLAGISTMMANAGGPVMTFYLLAKKFDKMAFVGTCAWFFFITNLIKLPLSWSLGLISRQSLMLNLTLIPMVVLGMLAGRLVIGKLSQGLFDWLLLIISLLASIRMILG
jgi:uncharacterized membrane protein YfcA